MTLETMHCPGGHLATIDPTLPFPQECEVCDGALEQPTPSHDEDPADTVCPNCGQWQRGDGDCLNECRARGFAPVNH